MSDNDSLHGAASTWVFGRGSGNSDPQGFRDYLQRRREHAGDSSVDPSESNLDSRDRTLVDLYMPPVLEALLPAERRSLGQLDVRQALLDGPDARALALPSVGLVGIDLGLLLLLQNLTVILFATETLSILGLVEKTTGISCERAVKLAAERFEVLMTTGPGAIDEFELIPDPRRERVCSGFCLDAEMFILAHELGHVALAPAERLATSRPPQAHSLVAGLRRSAVGSDDTGMATDRIPAWASEIAADRWATRILRRLTANLPPLWCDAMLFFVFHFIEVLTAVLAVTRGAIPAEHPPPMWRLQACVPAHLHLVDAHIKYFGIEPFKTIQYVLDRVRWQWEFRDPRTHFRVLNAYSPGYRMSDDILRHVHAIETRYRLR